MSGVYVNIHLALCMSWCMSVNMYVSVLVLTCTYNVTKAKTSQHDQFVFMLCLCLISGCVSLVFRLVFAMYSVSKSTETRKVCQSFDVSRHQTVNCKNSFMWSNQEILDKTFTQINVSINKIST